MSFFLSENKCIFSGGEFASIVFDRQYSDYQHNIERWLFVGGKYFKDFMKNTIIILKSLPV